MCIKRLDVNISLPFKGQRTYVQSADIFDVCIPKITSFLNPSNAATCSTTFIFRSFINTGMRLIMSSSLGQKMDVSNADVFGDIIVEDNLGKRFGQMVRNNVAIKDRKPDFENELTNDVLIKENAIILVKKNKKLSLTETSIALTKILHLDQISNKHKWIATRLQFPLLFPNLEFSEMTVEIVKNAGNKTTQSLIALDGEPLGKVMFNAMPSEG